MTEIKAIAFDWGGIFTEGTFDGGAVRNLARASGVKEDEIAKSYFPLMEAFEVGAFSMAAFHQRFLERSGLTLPFETFRATFLGSVRERAAMFEVLASIPEHYTVGMLSNNVPVLCDAVRGDPRYSRIEHFVFSNEIAVRKPDPRAFAALSAALGVPPEATVFVDDNVGNIEACRKLGYRGILLEHFRGFRQAWDACLPELALGRR
jgi:putative hydrolase of the HAD superfamily